jgi:HK97 family phage portal protein
MKFLELLGFKKRLLYPAHSTGNGGWFPIIKESFAGAWQRNCEISNDCALAYSAVFACITLIASDISKMRMKLVRQDSNGIWTEIKNTVAPVLLKPNFWQNRIKFLQQWLISKLAHGNAYIWKEKRGGKIVALYVLDPCRVTPLVATSGDVYYQLSADNLAGITESVTVPASEIIHDMMPALFHPLCGTPPLIACGLAALQGLNIQKNSALFFGNMSQPGGLLSAPGAISDETATRLKRTWEDNYSGTNAGRMAVVGDGLKYESMTMKSVDAQLIEQLKWTAENVCSCFHVPAFKVGFAPAPAYNNAEIYNQIYYSDCLQALIEDIELCLDEGLGLDQLSGQTIGVEFDLDALLRMDTDTRYKSHSEAIKGGWMMPNEARQKEDMKPVEGGDTPYLQQQNFSLAALAERDESADPFGKGSAPAASAADPAPDDPLALDDQSATKFMETLKARLAL